MDPSTSSNSIELGSIQTNSSSPGTEEESIPMSQNESTNAPWKVRVKILRRQLYLLFDDPHSSKAVSYI
jgi:hypothetical protein